MVNCYYFRCNALITIIPLTMIMMHCVEVWGMAAEKSAARSSGWQGQPERLHWIRVDGRNQLRGGTRSLLNHPLYLSSSYSDYWSEVGKIFSFTPTPTPTQSHFLLSSQLTTVLHSLPSMDGQTRTGWLAGVSRGKLPPIWLCCCGFSSLPSQSLIQPASQQLSYRRCYVRSLGLSL